MASRYGQDAMDDLIFLNELQQYAQPYTTGVSQFIPSEQEFEANRLESMIAREGSIQQPESVLGEEELMKKYKQLLNSEEMNKGGRVNYNLGGLGSIPQTPMVPQGQQLDGRGGGFIPMGAQEGKDDVPAMLANNEFVMTSDAVRAAGGGDINQGAQKMYDLMNSLEAKA